MTELNEKKTISVMAALVCLLLAAPAASGRAETDILFPAAYTEEELKQVRQWEQTWAGTRIDKSNLAQVLDYLPYCLQAVYANPEKSNAPPEGLYFVIAPYQRIEETPGMREATRQYSPGVKIRDDGQLEHYETLAGRPFPEPHTGLEIAWNYDYNTRGDSSHYRRYTPNIDINHQKERVQDADGWELFFAHRVDVEPRPVIQSNKSGIHWAGFYHMHKPNELLNTRRFNIRYLDPTKEDDNYVFSAQTRRLTRLSGAHRTDLVDGSIVIYDDEYCWNGQIPRNTYTLLGRKEYLAGRNIDINALERKPGQLVYNNVARERVNTYVVEVISRDAGYIYGKRLWYVDPETYHILCTQIYDREGRFWKFIEQFGQNYTTEQGDTVNYLVGCHVIDYQREYAACTRQDVRHIGGDVKPGMFTLANLQRSAY